MNKIEVFVRVEEGTGKSVIAEVITASLRGAGFRVVASDPFPDQTFPVSLGKMALDTIIKVTTAEEAEAVAAAPVQGVVGTASPEIDYGVQVTGGTFPGGITAGAGGEPQEKKE